MKTAASIAVLGFFAMALMFFAGCSPAKKTPQTVQTEELQNIIILPTEIAINSDDQADREKMQQLTLGAETINRLLGGHFSDSELFTMVSADQLKVLGKSYKKDRIGQAYEIGRQLNSDAVLITMISRFTERRGNAYAADQPASVAFSYKLISTKTGHALCSGAFDECQQSLFENLLSFSGAAHRKFKWVTANDLAEEGLQQIFDDCSYLQHP